MQDMTIGRFLDSVAGPDPTPGGGSVSALAGALGSALVQMVAGLTLDRKGFESCREEMSRIRQDAESCRRILESAIEEDSRAYESVMRAYGLPKGTDEEMTTRGEEIQHALKGAVEPPFRTAETCLRVLQLCRLVVEKGNPNAVTDAAVASLLAHGALQGGVLNVLINLSSISKSDYAEQLKDRLKSLRGDAEGIAQEIMALVKERMGMA